MFKWYDGPSLKQWLILITLVLGLMQPLVWILILAFTQLGDNNDDNSDSDRDSDIP